MLDTVGQDEPWIMPHGVPSPAVRVSCGPWTSLSAFAFQLSTERKLWITGGIKGEGYDRFCENHL